MLGTHEDGGGGDRVLEHQCVANLKAEIHNLQDENLTLYEKIKRMERNWDALLKQTTGLEATRNKMEREIYKARSELLTTTSRLHTMDAQNADLQQVIGSINEERDKLNEQLQHKLDELLGLQNESLTASEKYNQSMKAWKEEKRAMIKQREEIARKLDACEDELQAYFNENAKLEKQLKQVKSFI